MGRKGGGLGLCVCIGRDWIGIYKSIHIFIVSRSLNTNSAPDRYFKALFSDVERWVLT